MKKVFIFLIIGLIDLKGQNETHLQNIDGVAAIVDNNLVLVSDINQSLAMAVFQNNWDPSKDLEKINNLKSQITQNFIDRKVILSKALLDSIVVEDKEVDRALDQQMGNMISQAGGEEQAEKALGQPLRVFKREYWYDVKDMLITQKYQQQLINKVRVNNNEVRFFFESNKDNIDNFPNLIKLRHILFKIEPGEKQIDRTLSFLKNLKKDIEENKISFKEAASTYSQDPGSKNNGGSLGLVKRGDLVRDFEAIAFNLKIGDVSEPVETDFGFHIIQTDEIRGDKIKVKHILMSPPTTDNDESNTYDNIKSLMDSIKTIDDFILNAKKYSMDEPTKKTGGNLGWIDPNIYPIKEFGLVVNKINLNECSLPIKTDLGYHLLWIESIKKGGKPDINTHWTEIEKLALNSKKEEFFKRWLIKAKDDVYIFIK
tara:strand:+ start:1274 stop:2557 length:1284 start_codon:yes stop_codon:yes gene_type:complete